MLLWAEPDWFKVPKKKKEFFNKGKRVVAAQIQALEGKYVKLEVLHCEIAFDNSAKGVKLLKVGESITRLHTTLKKRGAERTAWGGADGESARAHVTGAKAKSKFLKD